MYKSKNRLVNLKSYLSVGVFDLIMMFLVNLYNWAELSWRRVTWGLFCCVLYRRRLGISSAWRTGLFYAAIVMRAYTRQMVMAHRTSGFSLLGWELHSNITSQTTVTTLPSATTIAPIMTEATAVAATATAIAGQSLRLQTPRLLTRSRWPWQQALASTKERVLGDHWCGMRSLIVMISVSIMVSRNLALPARSHFFACSSFYESSLMTDDSWRC